MQLFANTLKKVPLNRIKWSLEGSETVCLALAKMVTFLEESLYFLGTTVSSFVFTIKMNFDYALPRLLSVHVIWFVGNEHSIEEHHFPWSCYMPAAASSQRYLKTYMRVVLKRSAPWIIQVHAHASWVKPRVLGSIQNNGDKLWAAVDDCSFVEDDPISCKKKKNFDTIVKWTVQLWYDYWSVLLT